MAEETKRGRGCPRNEDAKATIASLQAEIRLAAPRKSASIKLLIIRHSGGVSERVFCEERADLFGIALQGMHR